MTFTEESQLVKDYLLLIKYNKTTLEEIPNLYNLKEVVEQCLEQSNV